MAAGQTRRHFLLDSALLAVAATTGVAGHSLWYSGGAVLLFKGLGLLKLVTGLQAAWAWPGVALACALRFGSLKVRNIFKPSCRKKTCSALQACAMQSSGSFIAPGFSCFCAL